VEHLERSEVLAAKIVAEPLHDGRQADGYGRKIAMRYMVQTIDKRWHRVYCVCFSNSGSCYIQKGGKDLYLACEVECMLEDLRYEATR
jgi:hypothetical protein